MMHAPTPSPLRRTNVLNQEALQNLQDYIRIPSVHPHIINYNECIAFLQSQARDLNVCIQVTNFVPGKPVVILTWPGTHPDLPSILLSSHMDVVPVEIDLWNLNPFGGDIDVNNRMHGRGTQEMKSVAIQYLEAVKRLKKNGVKLKRTIYMVFLPDEVIGGGEGMGRFVESDLFQSLNVGVVLDKGAPSADNNYHFFYGEKTVSIFHIHCPGRPEHASALQDRTAAEKLQEVINKFFHFREQQKKRLENNPNLTLADITTVNLTRVNGGIQSNMIPSEYIAVFDCRLPISVHREEWEATISQWCKDIGEELWIEYEMRLPAVPVTRLDHSNRYWVAFRDVVDEMGVKVMPSINCAASDSKYIRNLGIPVFGFSPINNTPRLTHGHNEYINIKGFLDGIQIYYKIIERMGDLDA